MTLPTRPTRRTPPAEDPAPAGPSDPPAPVGRSAAAVQPGRPLDHDRPDGPDRPHRHDRPDGRDRSIGRIAWWMAWVGLLVGQLHALARFRTPEGQEDLATGWTAVWAEPADRLLSPLLDWARPEVVYITYGKVWFPVLLALTLGAVVVYRRTRPTGVLRWAWRAALASYTVATVGVLISYWTQWSGDYPGPDEELSPEGLEQTLFVVGWFVSFPGIMLAVLFSSVLGVMLLVRRFRPVGPALLLAMTVPLAAVLLQGTSLGSTVLPVAFAFGLLGRRIARSGAASG